MESKINYTLVGLFVVLLVTGLIAFAYWLGKYGGKQEYKYYHVHMSESVAGLTNDASVKYRGVNVGTVDHVRLNPENSEEVELLLKIKQNTPIKVDTTATLKSFGLTGLVYVELAGGSGQNTPLLTTTDEIPVIPSRPSTLARIDDSVTDISVKVALALDNFNQLLSEENLKNVSETLLEIKILVKDMKEQKQGFQDLVDNGVIMEKSVTRAFQKIEVASESVTKMSDSLNKTSGEVGQNLSQDMSRSLESFNQLLTELSILAGYLQKTTQGIEASPSDLIFKRSQPKLGPGEEGYYEQ